MKFRVQSVDLQSRVAVVDYLRESNNEVVASINVVIPARSDREFTPEEIAEILANSAPPHVVQAASVATVSDLSVMNGLIGVVKNVPTNRVAVTSRDNPTGRPVSRGIPPPLEVL